MPTPLYERVFNELKSRIDSWKYSVNSFIPSEINLMKEFNVSRVTIRRAIQELELIGLVERIHGKGTRVNIKNYIRI